MTEPKKKRPGRWKAGESGNPAGRKPATATKPAARSVAAASSPESFDTDRADSRAKTVLRPSVNAAAVIVEYGTVIGEQDIAALTSCLSDGIIDLQSGNMQRAEAMLYAQADALQAIFMNLAVKATKQKYLNHWEAYLRMALKAQNQCRMTLETLATIKNPPVVFARQANINNGGQQQVNSGAAPALTCAQAGGVKSLEAPTAETALDPTHGFFPATDENQSAAIKR